MTSLASHSAAGQALGYFCQADHALLQLAEGTHNGAVGIETLDDVAVSDSTGPIKLLQSKATTDPDRNPVSDSSRDLWKTLATWTTALIAGEFDPLATELLLVTNATLPDCLARRIGLATRVAEITAVVRELRSTPPTLSASNRVFVNAVRSASDVQLCSLVGCIEVRHGGNGGEMGDIRDQIVAKCHLPDGVDASSFLDSMLGWVHNTAVTEWHADRPAWIRQQDFNNRRQAIIEANRRRRIREQPAKAIVCSSADVASHRTSGFVRQLDILDCDGAVIDDAITDFLKHNHERLRLVKEGHVVEEDWDRFEDQLVEHWKPIFRSQPATKKSAEQRRAGRSVYAEIQRHKERLAGQPTEEHYLTRGAYHRLADSVRVGWHPRYAKIVAKAVAS